MTAHAGRRLAPGVAARRWLAATAIGIALVAGCSGPGPSAVPSGASGTAPPGTVVVEIPEAGIMLPVPVGWQQFRAEDLADPTVRAGIASSIPGSDALVAAVESANSRADLVFIALDPSAVAKGGTPANIAVLVSQPSVSGPLLEFAAGFIDSGFRETLDLGDSERSSAKTPLGDAVRLSYQSRATKPVTVAWVIGVPKGTVLISTMGLALASGGMDPDAVIAALASVT